MKEKKSTILFIIGITLGILIGACATFFTVIGNKDDDKEKNTVTEKKDNNDVKKESKNDSFTVFEHDMEGKDGTCIDAEYSYDVPYKVIVNNMGENKDTFVYFKDWDDSNNTKNYTTIDINGKEISKSETSELMLGNVCMYNGYIVYSVGWEGGFYSIVKNGTIILTVWGTMESLNNNQLLVYDESDYDAMTQKGTMKSYILDLNDNTVKTIDEKSKKFDCNDESVSEPTNNDMDEHIRVFCSNPW